MNEEVKLTNLKLFEDKMKLLHAWETYYHHVKCVKTILEHMKDVEYISEDFFDKQMSNLLNLVV